MCTVTLTSSGKGFILTSNRDEAPGRQTLPPQVYWEQGVHMVYPKDVVAGGTWIGLSSRKRLICLLNGAFEKHQRHPPYRLSRGVVVKDLLAAADLRSALQEYRMEGIEPFTLITVEWSGELRFSEFVWDGHQKHLKNLPLTAQIWSSSPLYTREMKQLRQSWFEHYLQENVPDRESLLSFHHSAGIGDPNVDVIMDRGFVQTRSVTQVVLSDQVVRLYYHDLSTGESVEKQFPQDMQIS